MASEATGSTNDAGVAGFLFDLDGTLVDSVYQHVLSWHDALCAEGIELSVWRIHRRIGMSGGLFTNALLRETDVEMSEVRALPGARELLDYLTAKRVPWAIATSGRMESASVTVSKLGLDAQKIPIVTRDQVRYAKPDPDLFLAAAARLSIDVRNSIVVGDSVWDLLAARRAGSLGVGLLSGGYGQDELERAGAYRVYEDPKDLLKHLDEVGVRR
jgi:HAD superfamily hydrolase (TIGR01509 family)